jgi:hypothetical protein
MMLILFDLGLNMFEVSTLGQPFEVVKTHLAANRKDNIITATKKTYSRGGLLGFYQGLIPWAWIEASTKVCCNCLLFRFYLNSLIDLHFL